MKGSEKVKAWSQEEVIPTYATGYPDKNPLFLEKRVYQGSSGVVYPYPVIEKIYDTKEDVIYQALYLENEFIKVMILPQLGGRVQMAYDKIKRRHFVYYNHVIKPALVGLTGPWISGGIEFNWPQHHRPSTYLPLDWRIVENENGSVTIWVNEIERMFGQKGAAGFTLYPDKAYLEIKGQLFNRTPFPQTFLWWANPAVAVNAHYQSVFPPDVNAVFDHGKRDVSTFPIASGTYYKVDYSEGVDISRYKNIPVPTSYMAIKSNYEFVGGYENDTRAGVLHVANNFISPGKKQWTWGCGDFGIAWDRNLTDQDGPYIELMAGVFTDNQPDFSWMMPGEEKTFVQYFLPYRELGVVKNANQDILLNLEREGDKVRLKVFATSRFNQVRIVLKWNQEVCFGKVLDISPRELLDELIEVEARKFEALSVEVFSDAGTSLINWKPENREGKNPAEPAKAAKEPHDIQTTEQLYLTGLHLEQYRHATYSPVDYYQEALRRDPTDVRSNNAMGLWLLKRGKFRESEPYFRRALETLLEPNPNPFDGEAFYNLGVALYFQERFDDAYEQFYKATWNAPMKSSSCLFLGRISAIKGKYERALKETDQSLISNWHHHQSRHLKSALLRKTGCTKEALELISSSLDLDGFTMGCHYEKWLLGNSSDVYEEWLRLMRDSSQNYRELALDYVSCGFYQEALEIMKVAMSRYPADSMDYYYGGWICGKMNQTEDRIEILCKRQRGFRGYVLPKQTLGNINID